MITDSVFIIPMWYAILAIIAALWIGASVLALISSAISQSASIAISGRHMLWSGLALFTAICLYGYAALPAPLPLEPLQQWSLLTVILLALLTAWSARPAYDRALPDRVFLVIAAATLMPVIAVIYTSGASLTHDHIELASHQKNEISILEKESALLQPRLKVYQLAEERLIDTRARWSASSI